MSVREILRKYINLDNTRLAEDEKEEVKNMLYKYKEAYVSEGFSSCFHNVVSDFLMNKI